MSKADHFRLQEKELSLRFAALIEDWERARQETLFGTPDIDHEARHFVDAIEGSVSFQVPAHSKRVYSYICLPALVG